jgi:hypothetical protein
MIGESIAMRFRYPLDQSVQAQTAKLITHATGLDVTGTFPEKHSEYVAEFLASEPLGNKDEHQQGMEESLHLWIGEAQCRHTLACYLARMLQVLESLLAQCAIVADPLHFQQPPVGGEAHAKQCGPVMQ